MKYQLFAGAFSLAVVLAPLAFAQSTPPATHAPPPPGPAGAAAMPPAAGKQMGGGPEMGGGSSGEPDEGRMMRMMMRHMMADHMTMRADPKERCIERLARHAARRAYVEAKLDLTAEQRPLWDKLDSIAHNEQQKERQLCNQLKTGAEATVLERMDRAQQFLSARLDALQSARPAVQALYQALTPEQKAIFDHPFRRD